MASLRAASQKREQWKKEGVSGDENELLARERMGFDHNRTNSSRDWEGPCSNPVS